MRKVFTFGETTFDIIFNNTQPVDAKVGGSQLNTAISLGRLNIPVHFISQFGNDKVGDISMRFLQDNNVGTQYLNRFKGNSRVALAFLDRENNAEYNFYNPQNTGQMHFPDIEKNDIILFGSSYAVKAGIYDDLLSFMEQARSKGAFIIYDPNFRKSNLRRMEQIKPMIEKNFKVAHVVKGSDEDFKYIFGTCSSEDTWSVLQRYGPDVLFYTANKNGVGLHKANFEEYYGVPEITPVSTIGAGDNFSAGLIYSFYKNNISTDTLSSITGCLWKETVETAISFAQEVCMATDNYLSREFATTFVEKNDKGP